MTYKEKVTFDGKLWYQLEWEDVEFKIFDNTKEIQNSQNIEELENIMKEMFPNSNLKYTFIGKRKK